MSMTNEQIQAEEIKRMEEMVRRAELEEETAYQRYNDARYKTFKARTKLNRATK